MTQVEFKGILQRHEAGHAAEERRVPVENCYEVQYNKLLIKRGFTPPPPPPPPPPPENFFSLVKEILNRLKAANSVKIKYDAKKISNCILPLTLVAKNLLARPQVVCSTLANSDCVDGAEVLITSREFVYRSIKWGVYQNRKLLPVLNCLDCGKSYRLLSSINTHHL